MDKNQPLGGNTMPRFAGPATMMRLPSAATAQGLDAAFIGVPLDIAKGIVFLASDDAGYMNGAGLVLDGGFTAA